MKSKYLILSILILFIPFSGCVDNQYVTSKQETGIVGDWQSTNLYIRFNSDGSGEFSSILGKALFQYTLEGETLKVHDVLGSGISQPLWFDECNIESTFGYGHWETNSDGRGGIMVSEDCTYKIINYNTLLIKTYSKSTGHILDRGWK